MRSFPVLIMYAARSERGDVGQAAAELIWFIMLRKSNYYSYKLVLRRPRPPSPGHTVKAGPNYSENSGRQTGNLRRTERIGFKVL